MRSAPFYSNAPSITSEFLYSPFSLSLIPNTQTSASLQELSKSDILKSITVLMKTSFAQRVSYAPSHPVTGVCVGNFRKRGCPWHPSGKTSMTSLICIDFSHRLGTFSHLNFPTCSRLWSPRCTSQSRVIFPVDCHFNRIRNLHADCTWNHVWEGHVSEIEEQATPKRSCEFKSCFLKDLWAHAEQQHIGSDIEVVENGLMFCFFLSGS